MSLVDKSLVVGEERGLDLRHRLHESAASPPPAACRRPSRALSRDRCLLRCTELVPRFSPGLRSIKTMDRSTRSSPRPRTSPPPSASLWAAVPPWPLSGCSAGAGKCGRSPAGCASLPTGGTAPCPICRVSATPSSAETSRVAPGSAGSVMVNMGRDEQADELLHADSPWRGLGRCHCVRPWDERRRRAPRRRPLLRRWRVGSPHHDATEPGSAVESAARSDLAIWSVLMGLAAEYRRSWSRADRRGR